MKKLKAKISRTIIILILLICFKGYAQNNDNWSQWYESSCWKGIDIRVKKSSFKYDNGNVKWFVEIRNRYYKTLDISVKLHTNDNKDLGTFDRLTNIRNNQSKYTWFVVPPHYANRNYVQWLTKNLVFDGDYDSYKCDK